MEDVKTPKLDVRHSYCKPREFLLLASYFGEDDVNCTDSKPCYDCLRMCNIFSEDGNYIGTLAINAYRRSTPK